MADRASIRARIAALRAKTTRSGCTEAEAIAAAELAAKLMRDYGIADDSMEEIESPERTSRPGWRNALAAVIGRCTNTAVITTPGECVTFIGKAPGPEIAAYLREVLARAVPAEVAAFKAGTFYRRRRSVATRRQAVADFTDGLVNRLMVRLLEMFKPSMDEQLRLEAKKARDARYPDSAVRSLPSRETRFADARRAGYAAGGKVPLSHGVAGGRASTKPVKAPAPKLAAPPRQGSLF